MNFASSALMVSIVMFFTGFMLLCECPFWFTISALLAALAMPRGTRKLRIYAGVFCVAAIAMTVMETIELRKQQRARMVREQELRSRLGKTNEAAEALSGHEKSNAN